MPPDIPRAFRGKRNGIDFSLLVENSVAVDAAGCHRAVAHTCLMCRGLWWPKWGTNVWDDTAAAEQQEMKVLPRTPPSHIRLRIWNVFMAHARDDGSVCSLDGTPRALVPARMLHPFHPFSVQRFATPSTVAHQAPLPLGFFRQYTGVGCHFGLDGNFLTQGLNPHLLHSRRILYRLSHSLSGVQVP